MMQFLRSPRTWITASFVAGLVLTMTAWNWMEAQYPQTEFFNRGMIAYNSGNYDIAVESFDRSINEYQSVTSSGAKDGWFTPAPALDQVADAQFYKFMALLKMKNAKLALIAIKEALKLTTAENLVHNKLSAADLRYIGEQRVVAQTDLEILFHQKKEMQDAEGKGKGQGQPKPGDKPSEDPSNGQSAGKTPRDAL